VSGRWPGRYRVAVAGCAQSDIRRRFDRPLGAVAVDTARQAIADAGLRVDQVDGFVASSLLPSAGGHAVVDGVSTVSPQWLAQHLGANPRYAAGFQGYGQLPGSVAMAVNAITSGVADHVLVHRALHNPSGSYHANARARAEGQQQWTMPQGFFGPLAMIGLATNEYVQRYGASREALAAVVVEARKNGARVPWSFWRDRPLTVDDYMAAPLICDPVGRFDCDIPVDGVAAFVLTSAERARDLPHPPVHIAGIASGQPARARLPLHWPLDDIVEVGQETGRRLWTGAGLGPADVDLPQLYDGFSPFVWMWLEVLGFCPVGEAHRFVLDGGIDSDDPKALPVLSGGGALGNGRMHGVPQMLECYLQLSGRAGARQRPDARIGLACHSSPHYGGAVLYATEPT
jgi:acetyl-CoA acetyltransferase